MQVDATCTGCIADDSSTDEICRSYCLTPCELTQLSEMNGMALDFVQMQENWVSRLLRLLLIAWEGFDHRYYLRHAHMSSRLLRCSN